MIPIRQPLLSGRHLATAHRWASGLSESLGGFLSVYQLSSEQSSEYEPIIQLWCEPTEALTECQLETLRVLAGQPIAGHEENTIELLECNCPGVDGRCYVGSVPLWGIRFACVLPASLETNGRHVRSLALAHLKMVQSLEENQSSKMQGRAFVQQVTQDFEELTWLRGVSQQIGIADIRSSMLDVATSQLPMLRSVIRSELIALVPSDLIENPSEDSLSRITSVGTPPCEWEAIIEFVRRCSQRSPAPTLVFNVQTVANLFEPFPAIRNCILVRVEKQNRKFGYLVALNREMEFLGDSPEDFFSIDPNGLQFGTFEAGLLSVLATVLSGHATNGELFREQENLLTGVIRAVINAIDAKDAYTCGHSDRVASFAKAIAMQMGLEKEECERIYMSGLLHDVGKIGVPDSILGKPGKLTDEEFAAVKKHPEIGYQILKHLTPLQYVLPGVLHHHEAINGKGYPAGLVGEAIPLQGRILAVADAYDAMTSDRPYRKGMPSEKAEAILRSEAGVTWDEMAVQAILNCIAEGSVSPQSSVPAAIATLPPAIPSFPLANSISISG
ncbi:Cyclic di-GMP phosphodiesterase response regulator RpfG [Pirellula sp. SH-Sr6A]|uniref:HD-GYP domain-containing protein n=1 Tax=Pirellula sp. SH-Sr6A TaxID=1632865 RepID=UPI00078EC8F6|nr:HD-GYP domain-containing protein [Pirellula sp. SH-Sr6A]AMV32989.1 Cyclic di-GMP phosphodiesterase response regulator RpfG [Pirellula sp. SH-Sr6A]